MRVLRGVLFLFWITGLLASLVLFAVERRLIFLTLAIGFAWLLVSDACD